MSWSDSHQSYTRRPGPTTYYSHFSSVYLSACLAFQTLQVFRLMFFRSIPTHTWHNIFFYLYLAVLTLCGLIDGIAFCLTPKSDTIAIAFLAFIDGVISAIYLAVSGLEREPNVLPLAIIADQTSIPIALTGKDAATRLPSQGSLPGSYFSRRRSRSRKCGHRSLRIGNRALMSLHSLLVLISVAGAIELALAYHYTNP